MNSLRTIKMGIRAINLDFYGTLVDWLSIWIDASEKIINDNNPDLNPKEFALQWRQIQRKLFTDESVFIPYKANVRRALDKLCNQHNIKNKNYQELLFDKWNEIKPYPEVNEVLKSLKSKYKLTVCTNSARDLFDACAKKLSVKFDYVFISDETKVNKPHRRMYEIAVKSLGFKKESILHIASSQMDVKGATNAGLTVCWINRGKEKRLEETPKPKFEISNLKELDRIL